MSTFAVLTDIAATLKQWAANMGALTFEQNMGSIRQSITIAPQSRKAVSHPFKKIPKDVIFSNQTNGILDMVSKDETTVMIRNRSTQTEDCTVDVLIYP